MTIQKINLGSEPLGEGGDTYRSANTKINENFSNTTHAASRLVGTATGNVMEVGAFGIGGNAKIISAPSSLAEYHVSTGGGAFFSNTEKLRLNPSDDSATLPQYSNYLVSNLNGGGFFGIGTEVISNKVFAIRGSASEPTRIPLTIMELYHDKNTTKDVATGFLKASSPVLHVYNDKTTKIHEAEQLDIKVDKKGVGHYEIHGTTGLRKNDGWNMSPPRDLHGNVLCMIDVIEKDDVVILKTYKKKFDFETVSIVHDYDNPMDIPEGSCVEFRFNDVPKDVTDKSTSETESK